MSIWSRQTNQIIAFIALIEECFYYKAVLRLWTHR
jgi:hypothetical protein